MLSIARTNGRFHAVSTGNRNRLIEPMAGKGRLTYGAMGSRYRISYRATADHVSAGHSAVIVESDRKHPVTYGREATMSYAIRSKGSKGAGLALTEYPVKNSDRTYWANTQYTAFSRGFAAYGGDTVPSAVEIVSGRTVVASITLAASAVTANDNGRKAHIAHSGNAVVKGDSDNRSAYVSFREYEDGRITVSVSIRKNGGTVAGKVTAAF